MDFITLIIGILAIIVAVWSVFFQNKNAKNIAAQSGQMRKANVNCYFLDKDVYQKKIKNFCIWYAGSSDDVAIFDLLFVVENDGDMLAEDCLLVIKASSLCLAGHDDFGTKMVSPKVIEGDLVRSVESIDKLSQISYKLPKIYPKQRLYISEPFFFSETILESDIEFETKDKIKLKTTARAVIACPVDVLLMDKYGEHKSYRINIECVRGKSVEEAIERFRKVRNHIKPDDEYSYKKEKCLFLNYEIEKKQKKGNRTAYLMKAPKTHIDGVILEYLERAQ